MAYRITIGKLGLDMTGMVQHLNEKTRALLPNASADDIEEAQLCSLERASSVQRILDGRAFYLSVAKCEGQEPEGLTDVEYNADSGSPERVVDYGPWSDFMKRTPALRNLRDNVFGDRLGSDGYCFALNTEYVKQQLADLGKQMGRLTMIDRDRAKWMKFWCEEAINRYGNDAAIKFF